MAETVLTAWDKYGDKLEVRSAFGCVYLVISERSKDGDYLDIRLEHDQVRYLIAALQKNVPDTKTPPG